MKTVGEWLGEKPFTLALSSSFFGFYFHCGFASALYERGHKPQKLTGSSAGALIAGALASGLEPAAVRDLLFSMRKEDFWDPFPGLGYLRGRKFLGIMEKHFSPTFAKAPIPLSVAAFDVFSWRTKFLAHGSLPRAVAASCAVPVMFHPVRIDRGLYYDGGLFNKAGIDDTDGRERILGVFLESRGWVGAYEKKNHLRSRSPHHKFVRFVETPNVHPNALERGKEAYEAGYRRALKVFDQKWNDFVADA